jgi:hypothetical protein
MVKCSNCGFLASRNVKTRQLEETELEIRQTGSEVMVVNTGKVWGIYEPPICFARSQGYTAYSLSPSDTFRDKVKEEIQKERECEYFTKWQQGFTPKEHSEMLDRQRQLEQEERRKKSDRKWHYIELGITLAVGAAIAIIAANIG